MSPTTRVGESDPNRGTAPEAITPGRYAGRVAVVHNGIDRKSVV